MMFRQAPIFTIFIEFFYFSFLLEISFFTGWAEWLPSFENLNWIFFFEIIEFIFITAILIFSLVLTFFSQIIPLIDLVKV